MPRDPHDGDVLVVALQRATLLEDVREALAAVAAIGVSTRDTWFVFIAWLAARVGDASVPGQPATSALEALLAPRPERHVAEASRDLGMRLRVAGLDAW